MQCPPARTSQRGWIPPLIPGFPQKHVPTDKAEVARLNVTQPLKSRSINSIALYWLQISHKEQPRFKEAGTVHIPQQEEYQRICGHGFKPTPEAHLRLRLWGGCWVTLQEAGSRCPPSAAPGPEFPGSPWAASSCSWAGVSGGLEMPCVRG